MSSPYSCCQGLFLALETPCSMRLCPPCCPQSNRYPQMQIVLLPFPPVSPFRPSPSPAPTPGCYSTSPALQPRHPSHHPADSSPSQAQPAPPPSPSHHRSSPRVSTSPPPSVSSVPGALRPLSFGESALISRVC